MSGLYNWYAAREPFLSIHRTLTKEVISWLCDSERKHSVYLIADSWLGRSGVYQCSRAAAFIKVCSDAQRLAAVLYPSFGSGSHDIYQLSVRLAEPICYNDGPGDAALVLRHVFQTLRRKHKNAFDGDEAWPSEEQMSHLIKIVSGVFEFIDVVIQFVDWMKEGGPRVHLETFLAYMLDSPSPSDEQPYRALDHFYVRALSDIHPDVLSAVNKTFGLFLFNKHFDSLRKHPFDLVYLLSLESDISTQPHLERQAVTKAYTGGSVKNPYIRNPYFERFLEDPSRSGKFYFPRRKSSLLGVKPVCISSVIPQNLLPC
jgi:hypothetical protein